MNLVGRTALVAVLMAAVVWGESPAYAQTPLRCGPFTQDVLAAPEPREAHGPVQRFESINAEVKTYPYHVLFLGDSLTEGFDVAAWREHMVPRGVFNAGISGDRTEHLLWRLQHGNLAGPPPKAVVVLIGTNDIGHGRSPEVAAEGIRANLQYLRRHLPDARILLLGLWPRDAAPDGRLRRGTVAVNRLIQRCGDNGAVVYADIGGELLDPEGRLTPEISPDRLHFSALGYARLAPKLDALIDGLTSDKTAPLVAAVTETVQLEREHGVFMVPVRINDAVTIPFVLDSGAGDVSVPEDVFKTLL
ncbi:MAG TPA: GDSL-type esterase/lipase family protein, partial [Stellaceae bacterium]